MTGPILEKRRKRNTQKSPAVDTVLGFMRSAKTWWPAHKYLTENNHYDILLFNSIIINLIAGVRTVTQIWQVATDFHLIAAISAGLERLPLSQFACASGVGQR
jgi:hypothetical protein